MSMLFTPLTIGTVEIPNRFVRAPRYEGFAAETGEVTERLIELYVELARGVVGLLITGMMYPHSLGRALRFQTGIHRDEMIPGLTKLTDAVHKEGGKIFFQVGHAGLQTTRDMVGQRLLAPSRTRREPIHCARPMEMQERDIDVAIRAFRNAASRAERSGADGIQIGAGGGYLINQFLSPFFNRRTDAWGGSDANRFLFLKEVVRSVREAVSPGLPILVKLNVDDRTPREGITPERARTYAGWLAILGIDGLEIASGTASYSNMDMWRGEVPSKEFLSLFPVWNRLFGRVMLRTMARNSGFLEAWNLDAAKTIKPVLGKVPLLLVGGVRTLAQMEEIVKSGSADAISLARPLIQDPFLVQKFKEGTATVSACVNCNKCVGAAVTDMPVRCYQTPGSGT